jgi:hypothetical protein
MSLQRIFEAVLDEYTCDACRCLHGSVVQQVLNGNWIWPTCTSERGCRCFAVLNPAETKEWKGKAMPDPNAPGLGPEPMDPEEQERLKKLSQAAEAEKAEEALETSGESGSDSASPLTDTPSDAASSSESPDTPDETEEGVNEDEVGLVEGVGAERELDADSVKVHALFPEVRAVSVSCYKCRRKTETSVTYKQFKNQAETGKQPKFKTKCNMCNYVSTYVLTEEGANTIA